MKTVIKNMSWNGLLSGSSTMKLFFIIIIMVINIIIRSRDDI